MNGTTARPREQLDAPASRLIELASALYVAVLQYRLCRNFPANVLAYMPVWHGAVL